ncbi:MAG TPA: hypothetical protein VHS31_08840 [Tepidisphaeraceae bacterium]|nr:hypothetical protein [Tepidisphaeraceae bacterium]
MIESLEVRRLMTSIDPSFGDNGLLTTDISGSGSTDADNYGNNAFASGSKYAAGNTTYSSLSAWNAANLGIADVEITSLSVASDGTPSGSGLNFVPFIQGIFDDLYGIPRPGSSRTVGAYQL